jgi:hypothetical protein
MRINKPKCTFHIKEVKFLGYIISSKRIKIDLKKIQTIQDWPIPRNVIEVQKFIKFANFYRRFIKGYSGITTLLTDLIKKDRPFTWTKNEQLAFKKLKRRFSETLILAIFNPKLPIILKIDVSDYAIGVCIIQSKKEKKFHFFAFYSRKMSSAELNYNIYDKKLLAIVTAFQK